MMVLLDPTYIRDNVDYSFGDESGHRLFNGYMKVANDSNVEFMNKYRSMAGIKPYMTLFIDNIRLYRRDGIRYTAVESTTEAIRKIKDDKVKALVDQDLLKLCASLPDMDFVIFTGFEDTPIDEYIFDKIPDNVIAIYASNAISFGGKVKPIPYGLQRRLSLHDDRHDVLKANLHNYVQPQKLLYINYNVNNNLRRININQYFDGKKYVTMTHPKGIGHYRNYLEEIKQHYFVLCPDGNAIGCDCHRDFEVCYMRRVPILERSSYREKIFEGIPVLFIDSFFNITEELLVSSLYLYEKMKKFDITKLDMKLLFEKWIEETVSKQ